MKARVSPVAHPRARGLRTGQADPPLALVAPICYVLLIARSEERIAAIIAPFWSLLRLVVHRRKGPLGYLRSLARALVLLLGHLAERQLVRFWQGTSIRYLRQFAMSRLKAASSSATGSA